MSTKQTGSDREGSSSPELSSDQEIGFSVVSVRSSSRPSSNVTSSVNLQSLQNESQNMEELASTRKAHGKKEPLSSLDPSLAQKTANTGKVKKKNGR